MHKFNEFNSFQVDRLHVKSLVLVKEDVDIY